MKKMYFSGYRTSGTGPDKRNRAVFQNPKNLIPGKEYLVEEYRYESEREGNGGSFYSTTKTAFRVFDLKTKELLSGSEWYSVFRAAPKKNCLHEDLVYLDNQSDVQQCKDCFGKFKNMLVPA